MLTLLSVLDAPGAPYDWLLARMRGRRARVPDTASADPWSVALAETRWLYRRCEAPWRERIAPLLALLEVRQLVMALRLLDGGERTAAGAALHDSLLHPALLRQLVQEMPSAQRLRALTRLPQVTGLLGANAETAALSGMRPFEALFVDRLLGYGRTGGGKGLGDFFGELIDLRNLLALLKAQRWQTPESPAFLAGGRRSERALRRLALRDDAMGRLVAEIAQTLRRRTVDPLTPTAIPAHLAQLVLASVARQEGA